MDYEIVYKLANGIILIPWGLMLFAPKWKWTHRVIYSVSFPLLIAALYLLFMILSIGGGMEGGFDSLENLSLAFSSPQAVLVGWLHYLAFDLLVGSWELRDAQKNGISHLALVPCLIFTLMAGPIGFMIYMFVRYANTKKYLI